MAFPPPSSLRRPFFHTRVPQGLWVPLQWGSQDLCTCHSLAWNALLYSSRVWLPLLPAQNLRSYSSPTFISASLDCSRVYYQIRLPRPHADKPWGIHSTRSSDWLTPVGAAAWVLVDTTLLPFRKIGTKALGKFPVVLHLEAEGFFLSTSENSSGAPRNTSLTYFSLKPHI